MKLSRCMWFMVLGAAIPAAHAQVALDSFAKNGVGVFSLTRVRESAP